MLVPELPCCWMVWMRVRADITICARTEVAATRKTNMAVRLSIGSYETRTTGEWFMRSFGSSRWKRQQMDGPKLDGVLRSRASCSHENERALGEGGVDEEGHAREGDTAVDVVQQEKGSERPEEVEGEEKHPELAIFLA